MTKTCTFRVCTLLLLFIMLLPLALLSQNMIDVVYLKNGSIVRGIILEQIPNKTLRMQTADGNIFVFQMDEVERIEKQNVQPQQQTESAQQAATVVSAPPSGISLIGGASFPSGDFGATTGEKAGYAKTGFVAGLQYSSISASSIYFALGATYSMNKMDTEPISSMFSSYGDINIESTSWTTIFPSIALGFGGASGNVHPFIAGVVGYAITNSPEVKIQFQGEEATQPSAKGNAVAYGIIAGLQTNGKFSIFVRYFASKPKLEVTATSGGMSQTMEFEQPINAIQAMIGIGF